jgi:wax ester synthase-like acyl-CoA acyltransferase family protein
VGRGCRHRFGGDRGALVVVFHHVLADGIGGLSVLAQLVDGAPLPRGDRFPRRPPTWRCLLTDALTGRARALAYLPRGVRHVRDAVGELRSTFTTLIIEPARALACPLAGSAWRRRHQHRARTSHYQRQQAIESWP